MNAIGFKVGRFCTLGEVTIGCDGSNHPNLVRVFADEAMQQTQGTELSIHIHHLKTLIVVPTVGP